MLAIENRLFAKLANQCYDVVDINNIFILATMVKVILPH